MSLRPTGPCVLVSAVVQAVKPPTFFDDRLKPAGSSGQSSHRPTTAGVTGQDHAPNCGPLRGRAIRSELSQSGHYAVHVPIEATRLDELSRLGSRAQGRRDEDGIFSG